MNKYIHKTKIHTEPAKHSESKQNSPKPKTQLNFQFSYPAQSVHTPWSWKKRKEAAWTLAEKNHNTQEEKKIDPSQLRLLQKLKTQPIPYNI